jgi:hypothetical protein
MYINSVVFMPKNMRTPVALACLCSHAPSPKTGGMTCLSFVVLHCFNSSIHLLQRVCRHAGWHVDAKLGHQLSTLRGNATYDVRGCAAA